MTEPVIIALLTSITALGVAIITSYSQFKSNERIHDLEDKAEHQQDQIDKLKAKNTALWSWVISLVEQIRRKKDTPVPPPDALKSDPELARLLIFQQYEAKDEEGKE